MSDLSAFGDGSFDLVFHPTSNLFVPTLPPVWAECYRVLRPGGVLLSGFMNPLFFLFDHDAAKAEGILEVKYPLPYSDLLSLKRDERKRVREDRRTVEFSHSLEAQIGGQIQAGFEIIGFYEDYWDDEDLAERFFADVHGDPCPETAGACEERRADFSGLSDQP